MKAEEPHTDNQTKVLEVLWYRAQEKQGDVYEGIANTFVQLFLLCATGLIMNACYTHSFKIADGMPNEKTAIVTGAQQGIGAGLVQGFLKAGFKVVATSLRATSSLTASADSFSSMVTSASRTRLQKNATCGLN
jgi:3-oxoacyl-ACP reductase-like protein